MTYLLDTHYMLWAIGDSKKISVKIKKLITNPANRVCVSAISFWEVSLKISVGRLTIEGFKPEDLPALCSRMGFEILDLTAGESATFHQLKSLHHKDPFDRMLIWQAIGNNFIFVSIDEKVRKYKSEGLKILSK